MWLQAFWRICCSQKWNDFNLSKLKIASFGKSVKWKIVELNVSIITSSFWRMKWNSQSPQDLQLLKELETETTFHKLKSFLLKESTNWNYLASNSHCLMMRSRGEFAEFAVKKSVVFAGRSEKVSIVFRSVSGRRNSKSEQLLNQKYIFLTKAEASWKISTGLSQLFALF